MSGSYTPERYADEGKRTRLYLVNNADNRVDASLAALHPNLDEIAPAPIEVTQPTQPESVAPAAIAPIVSELVHGELSQVDQIRQAVAQINKSAA